MNRTIWIIHIFLNWEVVGKFDRMGDKTLNLQQFFAMSLGLNVENLYYVAIAVLACVLGAEIAGICMLIGKLRRARSGEVDATHDEYNNNGGANYAIAALSFGAVSATAELALFVLAIATLVGAFVLAVLLIVLYAKGYLLISAKAQKEAAEAEARARAAKQAEQEALAIEQAEEIFEEDEPVDEPIQEETDYYEDDEAALEAISNLIATEDAVLSEEYAEEETVQEEIEEVIEEETEEVVEETAMVAQQPTEGVVETVERTVITEGAPVAGGQAPIIEKHIIETTREIIKETNTTTVTEGGKTEQFSPATEEMMKAITEFMKLETQLRMEKEVAVERPAEEGEATPAFAEAEDEEVEVDEINTEDELEAEDEAEREADAEENDDEYESDLFGNERIVGFDEETGCYIVARYRKSCEAKLMQSRPATKKYYSAIRNALMGYEGTKERMSWTIDTYTNEHTQIAKINVRPRTLDLYLALEPSTFEDSVYRGKDVGGKKKYAETPFLYKVNSPRKLTLALELVQRACEEQGLSPIDIEEINYEEQYPFTDTETLIARGLVREYLREEKPAATFELDPDHVPQLIEEDETVIPANANFTWEFDNDQPEVEEVVEEPVEEPVEEVIEEVVEEAPVEETVEEPAAEEEAPAPAPGTTTTTTTTHETIRTTERHYTERYFAGGQEAEVSEETRTIEVLPEPAEEPIEAEAEEILPETEEAIEEEVIEEAKEVIEEEVTEEVVEEAIEEAEEVVEEETTEEAEEVIEEEVIEETEEEIIDDEIVEEPEEETTDEQIAQMQSAVAALFGDDIFEEDEPIEEPAPEETVEEVTEEEEETVEEEAVEAVAEVEEVEETLPEEPEAEEVEEIEEETEEVVEEYFEETVEEEAPEEVEEEYYEEIVYEEVPEEETEEEYYEEIVYEEVPEEETEEEYYEEEFEEVYEDEEFEEVYEEVYEEEEEVEEVEEEPAPAPAPQPASDVVLLDVCVFDDYFDNGAIVNLETLKQVGLAPESATRLKVYATGELKGQFTVEANHFTLDAIKAIGDADGDSIMIR